ncbi:contact-dependent growth inhibition system immunity protein [Pseudomonas sp. KK4]|uniref:contact-dependent growth inhibition system immunity protein n=1 Tax=Pseudomonas sp. KK4 TaxID=1855729 RepID=UPI00097BFE01|nr:contact-dependent growth inhibition system immunity protein [Pseudomonas sp. KK4]
MSDEFPELYEFLASYFHQDWSFDHDTEEEVIRSFVIDSSIETLLQVKSELQNLLATTQSEGELQNFLFRELSCYYYYPHAWSSGKAWLEHVFRML